jgi:glycosyltransferase involved in cell wall biosynthesis
VVGQAGLFFDPRDAEDIARAVVEIAGDPSVLERLEGECLPRSAELSWSNSASQMLELLETHARRGG